MALAEGSLSAKKSLRPDRDVGTSWRIEQQERFKRNAMISRLGSVADGVWMYVPIPTHCGLPLMRAQRQQAV